FRGFRIGHRVDRSSAVSSGAEIPAIVRDLSGELQSRNDGIALGAAWMAGGSRRVRIGVRLVSALLAQGFDRRSALLFGCRPIQGKIARFGDAGELLFVALPAAEL